MWGSSEIITANTFSESLSGVATPALPLAPTRCETLLKGTRRNEFHVGEEVEKEEAPYPEVVRPCCFLLAGSFSGLIFLHCVEDGWHSRQSMSSLKLVKSTADEFRE